MKRDYDSLSEAINGLQKDGYVHDFNAEIDQLSGNDIDKAYDKNSFDVDMVLRFEGNSNPGDNSILYAITTSKGKKGVLIDGFGVSGGQISRELMQKLNTAERNQ